MTQSQFDWQLKRIEKQFGKYGEERGSVLWDRVQYLSEAWFKSVIDSFLGSFRHVPTPDDFKDDIQRENDRLLKRHKLKEQQEVKDFWEGKYLHDEEKEILKQIIKKMDKNEGDKILGRESGPDPEWEKYVRTLERAAEWPGNTWLEYKRWEQETFPNRKRA